jgi:hypothetical protein
MGCKAKGPKLIMRWVAQARIVAGRRAAPETELARHGIDHHRRAIPDDWRARDASHERLILCGPNSDRLRLVPSPRVADVDVVVAGNQGHPGLEPDTDILGARALLEGLGTDGGVVAARGVVVERLAPDLLP